MSNPFTLSFGKNLMNIYLEFSRRMRSFMTLTQNIPYRRSICLQESEVQERLC